MVLTAPLEEELGTLGELQDRILVMFVGTHTLRTTLENNTGIW